MATHSKTNISNKRKYQEEKTLVFDVQLFSSSDDSYPQISYAEIYKNQTGKYPGKLGSEQFPTELNELDRRWLDEVQDEDIGDGYDEGDSFIDNTELYNDKLPLHVTTKYGGFYVNAGTLKLKEVKPEMIYKATVVKKANLETKAAETLNKQADLRKNDNGVAKVKSKSEINGGCKPNTVGGLKKITAPNASSPSLSVQRTTSTAPSKGDFARPTTKIGNDDSDEDDEVLSRLASSSSKTSAVRASVDGSVKKKPANLSKKISTKNCTEVNRQHTNSNQGNCSPIVKQANRVVKNIKAKLHSQAARSTATEVSESNCGKRPCVNTTFEPVTSSPSSTSVSDTPNTLSAPKLPLPEILQSAVEAFVAEAKVRVALCEQNQQQGPNKTSSNPSNSAKAKQDLFSPRLDDLLFNIVKQSRQQPSSVRNAALNRIADALPLPKKTLQNRISRILEMSQRQQLEEPISKFLKAAKQRSNPSSSLLDSDSRQALKDIINIKISHYQNQIYHRQSLGAFIRGYCERELTVLLSKGVPTPGFSSSALEESLLNEVRSLFPSISVPVNSASPASPAARVSPDSESLGNETTAANVGSVQKATKPSSGTQSKPQVTVSDANLHLQSPSFRESVSAMSSKSGNAISSTSLRITPTAVPLPQPSSNGLDLSNFQKSAQLSSTLPLFTLQNLGEPFQQNILAAAAVAAASSSHWPQTNQQSQKPAPAHQQLRAPYEYGFKP